MKKVQLYDDEYYPFYFVYDKNEDYDNNVLVITDELYEKYITARKSLEECFIEFEKLLED